MNNFIITIYAVAICMHVSVAVVQAACEVFESLKSFIREVYVTLKNLFNFTLQIKLINSNIVKYIPGYVD